MHICIIGMGAAGMMAASMFKEKGYIKKVSLIGSPHVPTIGVGESTTLNFEELHSNFDENFSNFVKECDAAVKYGVYYQNWNVGKSWIHHFKTKKQTQNNKIDHFDYGVLLGNKPKDVFIHDLYGKKLFEHVNKHEIVYERGKFFSDYPFSWHFDAGKYIQYLISLCKTNPKINFIYDTVVDCKFKNNNNIESIDKIILESGSEINADYYIISTGSSNINEQIFGVKYNYLTDTLLTNKALFFPLKYTDKKNQFHPYTIAKTMKNGWRWITPTWSRIGTGYVFSDNHISVDQAIKEFQEDLNDFSIFPNVVDFIPRYNPNCYKSNSCTIGMSSGFLEPLDAPGLSIGAGSVQNLINYFDLVDVRNHLINDVHNPKHFWNNIISSLSIESEKVFKFWCSFILNQYKTCHRDDTEFWKDHKSVEYDYYNFLIDNLCNSEAWPDYGASMMFHQTLSARNIQWKTPVKTAPFQLYEQDVKTMNHFDYIQSIRADLITV